MANPVLPQVSSRHGAPMGRPPSYPMYEIPGGLVRLRHLPLDAGGYDSGGAYWGIGQRLYWATDEDGGEAFFRATCRGAAKEHVRQISPTARFHK